MARVKISEKQAKDIVCSKLEINWVGCSANSDTSIEEITKIFPNREKLVVKVDQGIKKRGKLGLIGINFNPEQILEFIKSNSKYENFIIESLIPHEQSQEKYISLERTRDKIKLVFSQEGGIEIEENFDSAIEVLIPNVVNNEQLEVLLKDKISLDFHFISKLIEVFNEHFFSFLEINPLVIKEGKIHLLDLAVEVDDAAIQIGENINYKIQPVTDVSSFESEREIAKLDAQTPASLKLKILNPDGAIWMLLSGGGASLVLADEVADIGKGDMLGNYGEYSGNPTREDTYMYTKVILDECLRSKAEKKVLVIAGGVANFTDIVKTFKGVIDALSEKSEGLKKQNIKVFVRRGGPNQVQALAQMKEFLEKEGLFGQVSGPDMELTEIIHLALQTL